MIFGSKIKKRQTFANFDVAWSLTASFEGPWDTKGSDDGHYFPESASNKDWYSIIPAPQRAKIGTSWGLTGQFLYDFVSGYQGSNMPTKEVMQRLGNKDNDAEAKAIWKNTCWQWMKGDKIINQKIANILFDCFVRAQGRSTIFAEHLNLKCDKNTYEELGTRGNNDVKNEKTKKVWFFTNAIVKTINSMSEKEVIRIVKAVWKDKYEDTRTMCRFNAILEGKTLNDPNIQKACLVEQAENAKKRAAQPKPKHKFYSNIVSERKILFFTQPGCRPCLALKPTCEALARQYGFGFDEINIRTDSGKRLMTEYRIGATPEVVLIHETTTVSFGAAALQNDALALYLANLPDPDPFEDGKPRPTDGATTPTASNGGSWLIPTALAGWFFFRKPEKSIGVMDTNQKTMVGIGSALLLLWLMSQKSSVTGGMSAQELNAILEKSLENEGPWEPATAHTRKDKGNFHHGAGQYLGTSWGITADFLEDWYGTTQFEADSIRKISKEEAKKIITETVMTRARIAQIQDKWIAAFFFDWMWQRPGTCLEYVCTKVWNFSEDDYQLVRKGFWSQKGVPDILMAHLNGPEKENIFESLQFWRLWHLENTGAYASFREGVRNRINRYHYGQ
jgi:thiol-disulfide isomerase/thioredoxin